MSYRDEVQGALAAGATFAGQHATGDAVRTLLVQADGSTRLVSASVSGGSVASLVDLVPAAAWDEREAHDLYGVGFDGHEPLRPLVAHTPDLRSWTVPVHGHDAYQVAVGPIHAGVIESGHFRFHVVGDRILHLDAKLFYKHRGLERAAEGQTLTGGMPYVARACAACAVANGVAYAHACEDALGLRPTPALARVRTILLELERTWSHLNDIAAICAGVGFAAGNAFFTALTERARALNELLTGHRFLFGTVAVGGSSLSVRRAEVEHARTEVVELRRALVRGWHTLAFNGSFQDRLPDVGVVTAEAAARLGTVGPAARAAGVAHDVRAASPRLAYDGFEAVTAARAAGDVQARLEQRELELRQSLGLLESLLGGSVVPAAAEPGETPGTIGVGRVESARGATSCVVEREGDRVTRLRLRTGSYANWPSVAHAAVDNLLPDFPLINKSFELCYACVDR